MKRPAENRLTNFIFLLLGVGAVYCAVLFAGPYLDNYQVKQAVRSAHLRARETGDEVLRAQILRDSFWELGSSEPSERRLPQAYGVGLKQEDIVIQRGQDGNVLIRIRYQRRVRLRPLDQFVTLRFNVEEDGIPP